MTRLISILALALLATPAQARRAVRQAAVIVLDTSGQAPDTARTLQHQVGHELRQRGVTVSRRGIPARVTARVTARERRLRAYARAHRIHRIFELRLEPQGDRLLVTLAERGVPGKRRKTPPRFTARLFAARNQLQQVIASLVQAVLDRTQPRPIQAHVAVTVQNAPPTQVGASVAPAATVRTAPPEPLVSRQKQGEFLWGFSLEPGTYLRTAAGLYGGSGKLYYQLASRPLRLGGEIGGMGGSGRMLSFALRSQYLFPIASTAIAPLMGVGLGYLMQDDPDGASGAGAAFSASVGVQFSQLTWARLVAEAEVVLPTFSTIRQDPLNKNGIVDIVKHSSWNPAILFKLSCLF